METWKRCFRVGIAPQLSTAGLSALRQGLLNDDPNLLQGATTMPPPLQCVQDWPVEGCCGVGYAGWKGDGLTTVGEVDEAFGRACFAADQALGEPAACRYFLNWFDETPRQQMRRELLPEIEAALVARQDYTPTVAEAMRHPQSFVDGMIETTGEHYGNPT